MEIDCDRIVGIRLLLDDGEVITPEGKWAIAIGASNGDTGNTIFSWGQEPKTNTEVIVLGLAIERLLEEYNKTYVTSVTL